MLTPNGGETWAGGGRGDLDRGGQAWRKAGAGEGPERNEERELQEGKLLGATTFLGQD